MLNNSSAIDERKKLLDTLASMLSIHESATLLSKVHDNNTKLNRAKRYGLHPVKDINSFRRSKQLEARSWVSETIKFDQDLTDFQEFTEEEKRPLLKIFGFFNVGDGSIASTLAYQMIVTAESFEKSHFYIVQLDNERVHAETYSRMITTLVSDPDERNKIFNLVETNKSIKRMTDFIEEARTYPIKLKSHDDNNIKIVPDAKQLYVCLAIAEYLLFTPLFCIIFWYRAYKPGKIKQILFSNEEIARDECCHCMNGCMNYLQLDDKYTNEEIHELVDMVVTMMDDFADEVTIDVNLEELTPDNIKQYTRFVADDLLERVNHKTYYNVTNPFVWMTYTNLIPKNNFYELQVGEYSRLNVDEAVKLAEDLIEPSNKKKYTKIKF